LQYHIKLVGLDNIIVVDNFSKSQKVWDLYEKYNVKVMTTPWESSERIHYIPLFPELHKILQETCYFFTIIDTDEFLCFFDYEKDCIDNANLLNFISNNLHRNGFPTSWIFNVFYGKDFLDPKDVINFDFNLKNQNILGGKFIAPSSGSGGNIVIHNRSCGQERADKMIPNFTLQSCPELFLLHIRHSNFESRMKTNLNYAKLNSVNKFKELNNLLQELKNKEKNKLRHYEKELLDFYFDKDLFYKKRTTENIDKIPLMETDIIKNFIENNKINTNFNNWILDKDKKSSIIELTKKSFKEETKIIISS
jgi:hypothetical protein